MTPPAVGGRDILARRLVQRHPAEAASILETAPPADTARFLASVPAQERAALFDRLTPEAAERVLAELPSPVAGALLAAIEPNKGAALLARLEEPVRLEHLRGLPPPVAKELQSLMTYDADTAGQLMDPRAVTFRPEARARDALRALREIRRRRIQDVFLVDEQGRLVGSVPLQRLALAAPEDRLDTLAQADSPRVWATSAREEILEVLARHRVASLPVVDFDGRVLGVLRQDELMQAAQVDATSDLVTMVGGGKDERALSSPFFAVRKRLPWLQVNLLTAFLAAAVVGLFEGTIARFTALAVLLPVVAGQSGNTGAQALAVTMRGLALREIRPRHWLRVTAKELAVGAANGIAVAVTTAAGVYLWSRSAGLTLVMGLSIVISMTIAGLAGATIPVILTRLGQDPAQSSSIVLTTVTDVVGFLSFLGIATLMASAL